MVNNSEKNLDLLFYALSDRTRRHMLAQLTKRDCNVSELAEPHDQSLAGISKHLKILEEAKFVEKTREGRTFRCRANLEPLNEVYTVLENLGAYWRDQLESLEKFLSKEKTTKENTNGKSDDGKPQSQSRSVKDHSRKT